MIEALIIAIVGTALGSLLARESSAVLSLVSRSLLNRGLRRLLRRWPQEARDRWREEIEADFETYSNRPLASLACLQGRRIDRAVASPGKAVARRPRCGAVDVDKPRVVQR